MARALARPTVVAHARSTLVFVCTVAAVVVLVNVLVDALMALDAEVDPLAILARILHAR